MRKNYVSHYLPNNDSLNAHLSRMAQDGWSLHSFKIVQESENVQYGYRVVMERDTPEPPPSAHLTKKDYKTLKSAHEWLSHFEAIGAITRSEESAETWSDFIDTKAGIESLAHRAKRP